MECVSLVSASMLLQCPLAKAHFSPVSQQNFSSSLPDTVMKYKHLDSNIVFWVHAVNQSSHLTTNIYNVTSAGWIANLLYHLKIPSARFCNMWLNIYVIKPDRISETVVSKLVFSFFFQTKCREQKVHVSFIFFQTHQLWTKNQWIYLQAIFFKNCISITHCWTRLKGWHITFHDKLALGEDGAKKHIL